MAYLTCEISELSDADLLRMLLVTDGTDIAWNCTIIEDGVSFFDCLRQGYSLFDAMRMSIVNVGGTICLNIKNL